MLQIFLLIILLLLVVYSILLLIYRSNWKAIPDFSLQNFKENKSKVFISVVVAARNEEQNIGNLIKSLQHQSYPTDLFEIIIVNDFSTDETIEVIQQINFSNVRLLHIADYIKEGSINSYKKKAIEIGVAASKGELIVTTDADCIVKKDWLNNIAVFFEQHQPDMIVMPVLIKHNKTFLQLFQSIDFMCMQGITGAAIHKGLHGMCNGANLAYTKKIFQEVRGYEGVDKQASGDDMMLLHKISTNTKNKISYLKSPAVIVETEPVNTFKEFIDQRIRWASKATQYSDKTLLPVLLLIYLFNFSLACLIIEALINLQLGTIFYCLMLLSLKTIIEIYFLYPVALFFQKDKWLWIFPLLQPAHIYYTVIVGALGKAGAYQWKNRKVI